MKKALNFLDLEPLITIFLITPYSDISKNNFLKEDNLEYHFKIRLIFVGFPTPFHPQIIKS